MFIRSSIRVLILATLLLAIGAVANTTLASNHASPIAAARSLSASGQRLFATSANLGIIEINPSTGAILNSFAAPINKGVSDGLAFDGAYLYYLSGSWAPNTLYKLNPSTGSVVTSYALPPSSFRNGLAYLNGLIYILDWSVLTQDITVFNPQSGTVVGTLDINGVNPGAPAISGGLAGITNPDALLVTTSQTKEWLEVNPTTGKITGRFLHDRSGTLGAAVVDGRLYLGANTSSSIQIFARNGTSQGAITVPSSIGIQSLGGDDFVGSVTTPTATASPTATPTTAPTTTPSVTPTATVTATPNSTPSPTATANPTATPTSTDALGTIRGIVWLDRNGNGLREPVEPGVPRVTVELYAGGTQREIATSAQDGSFTFVALSAGTYEARETNPAWLRYSTTPDFVPVTLGAGETIAVGFGDWAGRNVYLPLILRSRGPVPPS